jgi:hypothetical protein
MSRKPSCTCGECPKCKRAAYQRSWSSRNKDKIKNHNSQDSRKRAGRKTVCARYGITVEQFEELKRRQGGVCAICGQPETLVRQGGLCELTIDHDHETGQIRGLLCNNCNRAIGLLKDNTQVLRSAAAYLERFEY